MKCLFSALQSIIFLFILVCRRVCIFVLMVTFVCVLFLVLSFRSFISPVPISLTRFCGDPLPVTRCLANSQWPNSTFLFRLLSPISSSIICIKKFCRAIWKSQWAKEQIVLKPRINYRKKTSVAATSMNRSSNPLGIRKVQIRMVRGVCLFFGFA